MSSDLPAAGAGEALQRCPLPARTSGIEPAGGAERRLSGAARHRPGAFGLDETPSPGDSARHRRSKALGRPAPDRSSDQWARAARGRARSCQDAVLENAGERGDAGVQAPAVHARHAAGRHRRHHDLQSAGRRIPHQARSDIQQPHSGRRDQSRTGQGPKCAARGDAGAPGHHRRADLSRCPIRSWCWRRRIRWSRKEPIPCPRRKSTAS